MLNKILWFLFYKKRYPDYILFKLNKNFIREQRWKTFQRKILLYHNIYDWGTALLTALVILLLIIVLINIIIPV